MKTIYLHAESLSVIEDDLSTNGYLIEVTGPGGETQLRAKLGSTYVPVGRIESTPAVLAEDGKTLITPPVFQPGEFANLTFDSDVLAGDFPIVFAPIHGTEILPTPNNPVSVLLTGGETSDSSSAPFTPQKVPESWVSRRAFFLALYEVVGISPDQIRAGLSGNITALIEFEAPYFDPTNPLFLQLATGFGVSEAQLALVWAKARRL